jgi:hypothetical protein
MNEAARPAQALGKQSLPDRRYQAELGNEEDPLVPKLQLGNK